MSWSISMRGLDPDRAVVQRMAERHFECPADIRELERRILVAQIRRELAGLTGAATRIWIRKSPYGDLIVLGQLRSVGADR